MESQQRAPQNSGACSSASFALSVCPNRICPEEVTRSVTLGLAFLTVSHAAARVRDECAVGLLRTATHKGPRLLASTGPHACPFYSPLRRPENFSLLTDIALKPSPSTWRIPGRGWHCPSLKNKGPPHRTPSSP